MKQLAIIGPTASGKSDLAISIAQHINAHILSIDSLSIYKEIDIVSAKPSNDELQKVTHFGVDELYPNQYFSVDIFIELYKEIIHRCEVDAKNLVIVGGTSFYLKSLLEGLSVIPELDETDKLNVKKTLKNLDDAYMKLQKIDPQFAKNISKNDRYRIEKALLIYEGSGISPSEWFEKNPPQAIIKELDIYNIDVSKELLQERITKRTNKMFELGLVDEVAFLEKKYTRLPHPMKSIGIVETLEYLDGKISKSVLLEKISHNTLQLAKRQKTFNKSQFQNITSQTLDTLQSTILTKF